MVRRDEEKGIAELPPNATNMNTKIKAKAKATTILY
jgi:hypothetical protein